MGEGPVAILAGGGRLPLRLVECLERRGRGTRILAFRGFAEPSLRRRADAVVGLLDIKAIMALLDAWKPSGVALVGAVSRPAFSALLGAYSLLRNRHEVEEVIARGDDRVLRGALELLETRGHRVLGVHELAPELLVRPGLSGRHLPGAEDTAAVTYGLDLLGTLSSFDVGQAVAVAGRRVLAVEGPEGTDRMLRRVRRLRGLNPWGAARREGGVLVKAAKAGQDLRVDLPTVGPRTVREVAQAGLAGLAVGAGSSLLVDEAEALSLADRLGVFLVSVELPWTVTDV